jgi:hypothetical protein
MSGLFGSQPKVKPAPPAPDRSSSEVQAAAEEQRKRFASTSSSVSSMLSGGASAGRGAGTVSRYLGGGV